jgi:hypothetical protein
MTMLGLGFGLLTQLGSFFLALRRGQRRAWVQGWVIILFATLMYAFSRLTVEVERGVLTVSFSNGLLRRTIDLSTVHLVEEVELPWYSGWGVHMTSRGWLYNVHGRSAIALSLANGRTFTVGTDEPAQLMAAIQSAREAMGAAL